VSLTITTAPPIEISEVVSEHHPDEMWANLESPVAGDSIPGFWIPITGWALMPSGNPVEICVSDRWEALIRFARRVSRPDIAQAFPGVAGADRAGYSIALNATRLPRAFDLSVSAIAGEDATELAWFRGTRRSFTQVDDLPLSPLAVTTLGRTGSTLLMTLLSQHPAIAAFRPTGYDSRPMAYGLAAATAMAAPSSRMQLLDCGGADDHWWLGRAPISATSLHRLDPAIRDAMLCHPVDELLHSGLRQAAQSALQLARTEGKSRVTFAAEKCGPSYVPRLLSELSDRSREVFLVRDFRDVLASILAFNAKRGYAAFGREDVRSDAEFIARFALDLEMLAASWMERWKRSHLVRYEDLVRRPAAVLEGLFGYLGLETSSAEIGAIIAGADVLLDEVRREHRTTEDSAASTGRWLKDLSPDLREACGAAFDGPLREFGYT
jgi:Sulfotransferase family